MGSIRTLLAISVLITHSAPLFGVTLLTGDMAITCFFMISGFLMGLILDGKYSSRRTFYINRALRIYPPYFVALVLSFGFFVLVGSHHHDPAEMIQRLWNHHDGLGLAWAAISNITLVGIDLTRYAGIDDGMLVFPRIFHPGAAGGHNLLFVPQAWTLALELQYYLLAPFVMLLRTRWIVALTVAAAVFHVAAMQGLRSAGYDFDPASSFPFQVQYFLLGGLAYRAYRLLKAHEERWPRLSSWAVLSLPAALLLIIAGQPLVAAMGSMVGRPGDVFYGLFALLIPFLFMASRTWRLDRWIGEFSYPIYLFHFVTVAMLEGAPIDGWRGEIVLALTVLVSALYIYLLDRPLQARRARLAARQGEGPTDTALPPVPGPIRQTA